MDSFLDILWHYLSDLLDHLLVIGDPNLELPHQMLAPHRETIALLDIIAIGSGVRIGQASHQGQIVVLEVHGTLEGLNVPVTGGIIPQADGRHVQLGIAESRQDQQPTAQDPHLGPGAKNETLFFSFLFSNAQFDVIFFPESIFFLESSSESSCESHRAMRKPKVSLSLSFFPSESWD